jgi:hypothetical protein
VPRVIEKNKERIIMMRKPTTKVTVESTEGRESTCKSVLSGRVPAGSILDKIKEAL